VHREDHHPDLRKWLQPLPGVAVQAPTSLNGLSKTISYLSLPRINTLNRPLFESSVSRINLQ